MTRSKKVDGMKIVVGSDITSARVGDDLGFYLEINQIFLDAGSPRALLTVWLDEHAPEPEGDMRLLGDRVGDLSYRDGVELARFLRHQLEPQSEPDPDYGGQSPVEVDTPGDPSVMEDGA